MTPRLVIAPSRLIAGTLELSGDDHHYLFRVLRLRRGAAVTLLDGAGRAATAEVERVEPARALLRVDEPVAAAPAGRCSLTVLLPLIKGDRTEWAIQKLVELGVDRIAPVRTERCVVRPAGKRAADRRRRYAAVAEAAARQCRRATVPEIPAIAGLDEALDAVPGDALRLMLWESARGRALRAALPAEPPARAALLVGPEGGFSPAEVERAAASGWLPVGLGPHILRVETAAIAGVVVIAAAFGNLD